MFAASASIIVNDPANIFTRGKSAVVKSVAQFGDVTVYTVRDARGWEFALRGDKVKGE